jgi:hypothetical protein
VFILANTLQDCSTLIFHSDFYGTGFWVLKNMSFLEFVKAMDGHAKMAGESSSVWITSEVLSTVHLHGKSRLHRTNYFCLSSPCLRSWASVDGQVTFAIVDPSSGKLHPWQESRKTVASVVAVSVEVVDQRNPYGQLSSAEITIEGPVSNLKPLIHKTIQGYRGWLLDKY